MSTLRVDTITNRVGTGQPEIDGVAKAWVNFNGTGTVAIRASFNVTSITDNGTGNYTVNFTNAMSDANYCVNVTSTNGGFTGYGIRLAALHSTPSYTTSSVKVCHGYLSGSAMYAEDGTYMNISVFR